MRNCLMVIVWCKLGCQFEVTERLCLVIVMDSQILIGESIGSAGFGGFLEALARKLPFGALIASNSLVKKLPRINPMRFPEGIEYLLRDFGVPLDGPPDLGYLGSEIHSRLFDIPIDFGRDS